MDINDILALTKAGFTKDDIMRLAASGNPKTRQKTTDETKRATVQKESEPPKAETTSATTPTHAQTPAQTVNETPTQNAPNSMPPLMSDAQIKQLAQALNIGSASIDVPNEISLDDKMKEHFTNLVLGKE